MNFRGDRTAEEFAAFYKGNYVKYYDFFYIPKLDFTPIPYKSWHESLSEMFGFTKPENTDDQGNADEVTEDEKKEADYEAFEALEEEYFGDENESVYTHDEADDEDDKTGFNLTGDEIVQDDDIDEANLPAVIDEANLPAVIDE